MSHITYKMTPRNVLNLIRISFFLVRLTLTFDKTFIPKWVIIPKWVHRGTLLAEFHDFTLTMKWAYILPWYTVDMNPCLVGGDRYSLHASCSAIGRLTVILSKRIEMKSRVDHSVNQVDLSMHSCVDMECCNCPIILYLKVDTNKILTLPSFTVMQ